MEQPSINVQVKTDSNNQPKAHGDLFDFQNPKKEEMSEIAEQFQHRIQQFKSHGTSPVSQAKRREELLRSQKQKRQNFVDNLRKVSEIEIPSPIKNADIVVDNPIEIEQEQSMPLEQSQNKKSRKSLIREDQEKARVAFYKAQFMLPEPLTEIPNDLIANWLAIPIPKNGVRCLVHTASGL